MSVFRRPPLPLTAPDGRVFAWACPHCLTMGDGGHADDLDPEVRREAHAAASLTAVSLCGVCRTCDTFTPDHAPRQHECADCEAKRTHPSGRHTTCWHCKGERTIGRVVLGAVMRVECPTCKGDGSVWAAA